ncbi:MAG: hypothetical protein ABH814_01910 [bacterium]
MIKNEKGQILIIFAGIMAISLGVGLSMSRRGVLNLQKGNRSVIASKAYYAAEGGAEKGLAEADIVANCPQGTPSCSLILGDCAVSYYGENLSGYSTTLGKDRFIVLNTETAAGNINVSWNAGGSPNALEIIEVYDPGSGLTSRKLAYNCGTNFDGFIDLKAGPGSYNCSTGNIAFSLGSQRLIIKILLVGGTPSGQISWTALGLPATQAVAIYSTAVCGSIKRTIKVIKPLFGSGQDFSFGLFAPNDNLSL